MPSTAFATKLISADPDAIAPDGAEVRILCASARGSTAMFTLRPGMVSRAVAHHSVEEIWYVTGGSGRMWRKLGGGEEICELAPGVSLTVTLGTHFLFRCDGPEPLHAVAVTMPPWSGAGEAYFVPGKWPPTA